ncbi:pyridoxal-phosphate dependent enzyme [Gracilimonas sediminicola]|uniref:Pyridoxal-phosphate dependent enzyme n=1 Tax=Gracilimonas sediminicola TaxID=2952158 RepID=A0A9X2L182_9BACT|nr:pyridoxal-phosphate dependent enzyme [Gracilimonas sediminicola]MCP9290332.1 pyridoxal-phosphate dependent enzyme [Gracilimonas sediminicola]
MKTNLTPPVFEDVKEARQRISEHIHRTPVLNSKQVNQKTGGQIFFKCENFQKVGAFKFRGASNAIFSLSDDEAAKGVATHSSGNHAQALALAAKLRGIPAYVVMPENAPKVKVKAVKNYGAEVTFCESTLEARESTLEKVVAQTGATFIHPYDDARIVAGQGTAALELLEDHPDLDMIIAPVGGGGLLSGTALAAKSIKPDIQVIGAEPANADDAFRSFQKGELIPVKNPDTIADGLRTSLGELPFSLIRKYVDDIVTVPEESIIEAMRYVWERMNMIIEASCAVPVAAVFDGKVDVKGKKVAIIITGGNVDLDNLPW